MDLIWQHVTEVRNLPICGARKHGLNAAYYRDKMQAKHTRAFSLQMRDSREIIQFLQVDLESVALSILKELLEVD